MGRPDGLPAEERLDAIVSFANHVVQVSKGNWGMIMGITAPPFLKAPAIITTVLYKWSDSRGRRIFRSSTSASSNQEYSH